MMTFSCFRMATFRPATRKYVKFHALRFRLLFVVSLPGGAKGSHAKTCQNHHLMGFCVATFRPAMQIYDTFVSGVFSPSICRVFAWRGERSSHVTVGENATHGMWRNFVWWGEKWPFENTKMLQLGGFTRRALSLFCPENTLIRYGTNQSPYLTS